MAQRSGNTQRPVAVNDHLFDAIERLVDEVRDIVLREAGEKYDLPLNELKAILERGPIALSELPDGYESPEQIDKRYDERRLHDRQQRIIDDVTTDSTISYHITYDNGYSEQTDNPSALKEILSIEPDSPASLTIRVGLSFKGPGFTLRLNNSIKTAQYNVIATRKDANYIAEAIKGLLKSSEPSFPILHSNYSKIPVLSLLIGLAATLLISYFTTTLNLKSPNYIAVFFLISVIVGGVLMALLLTVWDAAFPKCQFEYGPSWRKRTDRRKLLWIGLSVLLIPALINIFI